MEATVDDGLYVLDDWCPPDAAEQPFHWIHFGGFKKRTVGDWRVLVDRDESQGKITMVDSGIVTHWKRRHDRRLFLYKKVFTDGRTKHCRLWNGIPCCFRDTGIVTGCGIEWTTRRENDAGDAVIAIARDNEVRLYFGKKDESPRLVLSTANSTGRMVWYKGLAGEERAWKMRIPKDRYVQVQWLQNFAAEDRVTHRHDYFVDEYGETGALDERFVFRYVDNGNGGVRKELQSYTDGSGTFAGRGAIRVFYEDEHFSPGGDFRIGVYTYGWGWHVLRVACRVCLMLRAWRAQGEARLFRRNEAMIAFAQHMKQRLCE